LKEVFKYPLGPFPWALAGVMGDLKKTNKSALLNEVEKLTEPLDSLPDDYASRDKDQTVIVCLSDDTLGGKSLGDNSGESTLKSADSIACEISTHSLGSEMSERSSQVRSNLPHCNTVLKRDCDCQCRLL
jgi:hypothetical protein